MQFKIVWHRGQPNTPDFHQYIGQFVQLDWQATDGRRRTTGTLSIVGQVENEYAFGLHPKTLGFNLAALDSFAVADTCKHNWTYLGCGIPDDAEICTRCHVCRCPSAGVE